MFGSLGLPELILIFIVALLLFGPRKLPEIGRSIGKAMGEFRRASNDLRRTVEEEVAAEDLRAIGRDVRQTVDAPPPPPAVAPPTGPGQPTGPADGSQERP